MNVDQAPTIPGAQSVTPSRVPESLVSSEYQRFVYELARRIVL